DLLYPRECLLTGEPVEDDSEFRFLSKAAVRRVYFIDEPFCPTCGAPFWGELIALRECPHCVELNPAFANGRSLFLLRDTGRELIHELKYRKGQHLLPDIRALVQTRPRFLEFLFGAVLVPIPLHPIRERERGYNQSLLIARELATAGGVAVAECLERVKFTETQTRLDRSQRLANLRNAFGLRKGVTLDSDQRYILVDDVFTTGSTLNAAAVALLNSGAEQVDAVTLGHG
ncbi:MAG: ComF family protein, partial [Puniceicoccales bacterium]